MTIREITYTICPECRDCNDMEAFRCRRCGARIAIHPPVPMPSRAHEIGKAVRFVVFGLAWAGVSLLVGMLSWLAVGRTSLPGFAVAGFVGVVFALVGALWLVRRVSLGRDHLVATLLFQSFLAALIIGATSLGMVQLAKQVPYL